VFGGRHEVRNRYQEKEKRRDVKIQLGKFERSEKNTYHRTFIEDEWNEVNVVGVEMVKKKKKISSDYQ
jgi:hypothetical protein